MLAPHLVLEQDGCMAVEGAERQRVLRRVRSLERVEHPSVRSTAISRFDLPFYTDVDLFELKNPRWTNPAARLCFLGRGGSLSWLDGESSPIHAVNAKADLRITETNVLEYLAFFCFFVRGERGPFLIVDRLDNAFIPCGIDRATLEGVFRSPKIFGQDHNGDWRISALVYYADVVFFADFLVQLNGMIEMMDDWPVAEDLGDGVDAPLSATRAFDS